MVFLLLGGYAVHQVPYVAYPDRDRPLRNTAVLVAFDTKAPTETGADAIGVADVDGSATDCFSSCPFWVRVAPGTHAFKIRYQANSRLSGVTVASPSPGFTISLSLAMTWHSRQAPRFFAT